MGAATDLWAFTRSWGVDLGSVSQPVEIWHGDADTRVAATHARELASQLARPTVRVFPGDGHFAIAARAVEQMSLLGSSRD